MGNDPGSGGHHAARRLEIESLLRDSTDKLARQQRLLDDLKRDGSPTVEAKAIMRLLMREQEALLEELSQSLQSN
jgi:hypothetical protein